MGWYGPAAVHVYTARKGVRNGGENNALRAQYNKVGRENLGGGCREKLTSRREKMIRGRENCKNDREKKYYNGYCYSYYYYKVPKGFL